MATIVATKLAGTEFHNGKRVHRAITANAEKRLLLWIGERLPAWVTSDGLTGLGFAAQILAGIAFALSRWNRYWMLAVCVLIALNWFGDSLDGTIARLRNKQRPRYGFYVDHIIDAFGASALMVGLGFSGYLHWQIAMALLVAFLLVSIESFLATYTLGEFKLSHGLFGPTEIRILLIVGSLWLLHNPHAQLFGKEFLIFDIAGLCGAVGMIGMAAWAAIQHIIALYRLERV